MKNVVYLFLCVIICNCQTNIISSRPFYITKKIISFKENSDAIILITENNDIIEVRKENSSNNCKKIKLGKGYTFKVIPVSDLILQGVESPKEYILNDSTVIKYNHYYSTKKNQNICIL